MAGKQDSTPKRIPLFYVGQRVFHVETERVGTITRPLELTRDVITGAKYMGYSIHLDGMPKRARAPDGKLLDRAAPESELRPIYDGNKAVPWSECLWRPMVVKRVPPAAVGVPSERSMKQAETMRAKWADPEFRERNRAGKERAALKREAVRCARTVAFLRRRAEGAGNA